jgi:hypothetical protein
MPTITTSTQYCTGNRGSLVRQNQKRNNKKKKKRKKVLRLSKGLIKLSLFTDGMIM